MSTAGRQNKPFYEQNLFKPNPKPHFSDLAQVIQNGRRSGKRQPLQQIRQSFVYDAVPG